MPYILKPIFLDFLYRRSVAQFGSASALGAEGRRFESSRSDHLEIFNIFHILAFIQIH
jgi:hypothetical protein